MDRTYACILINSTPAYYYILPLMITMLQRYAPDLRWPIILATEDPEHLICREIEKKGVRILPIPNTSAGFLESRLAALEKLASEFKYCLPLQDDFILEMPMDSVAVKSILDAMDQDPDLVSARLMPCPGPKGSNVYMPNWMMLDQAVDEYGFVFQATLWKTDACRAWYSKISEVLETMAPKALVPKHERLNLEIRSNLAENSQGQQIFWEFTNDRGYKHVAWSRKGIWPNAVYLSPFPYRPTAIVRGKLEEWAIELSKRERVLLDI
jgi:hypothetical protein